MGIGIDELRLCERSWKASRLMELVRRGQMLFYRFFYIQTNEG